MRKRLAIIALLLCSFFANAQTYNFSQYAEEKGLGQSYIYCISQSKKGYLVLSAGEALCHFDGTLFNSVTDSIMKANMVVTHFIDSRNTIWLGHRQYGVSFINYRHPRWLKDSLLQNVKVSQFAEDDKKNVWLAGSNGIYSMDTLFKLSKLNLPEEKLFNCITFDLKRNILAGGPDGLTMITLTNTKNVRVVKSVEALKDKNVKQIISADGSGKNFWVLADDVIYGIAYKDGSYTIVSTIAGEASAESYNIPCIYRDRFDNLWISEFGNGLRKLSFIGNPVEGKYAAIKINRHNGLKSQNIQSIFQDAEGNMWFGTFGEGLIKKPLELFSFFGTNEGIQFTDIKKVIAYRSELWMATDEGLAVFNRDNNSYFLYNGKNGFVNDKVSTLFLDPERKLWIGTVASGVYMLDLQTRRFENFSAKHAVTIAQVNYITQAGSSVIIATTDGMDVCDRHSAWCEHLSTNDGLLHNNVNHVFEDSKKRLWISSHGAPPYYIFSQKVTAFTKVAGLKSFNIIASCEDQHGNIWLATDGDGVFKYDNKDFYNYTTGDGLLSDYCTGIEIDRNNSVWVTHRAGLSELKENLKKFTVFSAKKGLLLNENNVNAMYLDSAANLWFGTTKGIASYNIESGRTSPDLPEIFITDIQLNSEYLDLNEPIVKSYGYYSVHIDYKSISQSEPEAIYYKYRLTDVDTNWKITTMPYIDFPKLGDGDYTFEVIACNSGKGLNSAHPATVSFSIQKPVWKHAWFYLCIAALFMFASYGIIIYRTRSLKKTQLLLQDKVEEKTLLLKQEKEAVESIKNDLELKNKDITDSIHYAKNIQDSLLPPDELMQDLFKNNSFVLYKPKDIVSGDFYWCSASTLFSGETLSLAAVIDCTGHGVPGAFLSILANDFLKQSVTEKHVNAPHEILDYLNTSIISHFNQHSEKNKIRDGMDIALVGINYREKKLYYAGANNPIYIFRKAERGIEEIIIKPTKQAIGSANEVIKNYDLQIIDLLEGDMIYLFSDGYADQFGGERNKKITYKTFRAILSQAFALPVHEQKQLIDQKLEAWKKGTEQTDDVCVMGIRI